VFCPHCGARQSGSARFCERCGKPLEPEVSPAAAKPAPPPPAPEPRATPPPPPAPPPAAAPPPASPPPARDGIDRRWLFGGLAVLVVAVAVVGLAVAGVFSSGEPSRTAARRVAAPAPTSTATVVATPATATATAAPTTTAAPTPAAVRATVKRTCGRNGAGDCHLSVRAQPSSAAHELARLNEGAALRLTCQVRGESVHSSVLGASSTVWSKTTSGGYVASVYLAGPRLNPRRITLRRC
jgi:hypothetical protein